MQAPSIGFARRLKVSIWYAVQCHTKKLSAVGSSQTATCLEFLKAVCRPSQMGSCGLQWSPTHSICGARTWCLYQRK